MLPDGTWVRSAGCSFCESGTEVRDIMKLIHLADLHLGKRVNEFSMLEDQRYVLEQVIKTAKREKIDGIIIAGDIYDRQVPPVEAVKLLDDFLTKLACGHVPVYAIGGNHDSMERVSFGSRLMAGSGVHMASEYDGRVACVPVRDAYGVVDIYLLPFIKPVQVRAVWRGEAEEVRTYQEALSFVIGKIERNEAHRSILIAHQFVTGAAVCDSEEHIVGGLDQVDVSCFDGFDYVALGHLHGPQPVGRETVRYAGTLLKYSFSEIGHRKGITLVELREKGKVQVSMLPVSPLHEMRHIRGSYEEVTNRANYKDTDTKDYVRITLTDEEDIFEAVGKLRIVYPNLMKLDYDNVRTRQGQQITVSGEVEKKTPLMLVQELFALQNNKSMSEAQREYIEEVTSGI